MPALERALAFEQRHDLIASVGEDLDLDMARTRDETLDVERAVAERASASRRAASKAASASSRL
jgi:hypothetical protein